MPSEIVVPELGESVVEATVANWLKNQGERVSVGEPIVELETDKVDLEVGATQNGTLGEIKVQAGEDVQVGDVLGFIEDLPEGGEAEPEKPSKEEDKEPAPDKYQKEKDPVPETEAVEREAAEGRITPVARRYAQEHGVDISNLTGDGPDSRITKGDVERFLEREKTKPGQQGKPIQEAEQRKEKAPPEQVKEPEKEARQGPGPKFGEERREERIRMSRRRRTIASRLLEAQQNAAMLTTFNDVDMTAVMELRKRRKDSFQEAHGVKLGLMSFFVKASVGALKRFPHLNAELEQDEIILKHYYDIGIAIGAEEGLIVPVVRAADRLTFAEIERQINEYVDKVQEGTLSIEELRGGTFTITNGGVFGSLLSTPILNPPQVSILGMHRIEDRPIAVNGRVVIRPMMYLALSYDHRIVDGREAVQFLAQIKAFLEDPETLLLEG